MFLPMPISFTQNSIIENTQDKIITVNTGSDNNICTFSPETNGLILQYGENKLVIKIKFYSIGKYRLYAFLHYVKKGHYVCYFEFNNEWYQFDDYGDSQKGSINKVINFNKNEFENECFLFFYEVDDSLEFNVNVTMDEYLEDEDHTLIITDDESLLEKTQQNRQKSSTSSSTPTLIEAHPLPRQPSSRQPPSRLPSSLTSTGQQQRQLTDEEKVFTSQLQVTNNCEQHGKNWLELFVLEGKTAPISSSPSAPPVALSASSGQPDTSQLASAPSVLPETPPLASAPSGLIVPETPQSVLPEALPIPLTEDDLKTKIQENKTDFFVARKNRGGDKYSHEKKKINIMGDNFQICNKEGNACGNTAKLTDPTPLYIFDDIEKAENFIKYMNVNKESQLPVATITIKPKTAQAKITTKPKTAEATETQVVPPAATKPPSARKTKRGGSRKIRRINIKGRNKTRKGKRSKKGIRYKNKLLKCNKLKTNRLRRKKTKKNNFNKRTRKS
jgi:hypothetical protein